MKTARVAILHCRIKYILKKAEVDFQRLVKHTLRTDTSWCLTYACMPWTDIIIACIEYQLTQLAFIQVSALCWWVVVRLRHHVNVKRFTSSLQTDQCCCGSWWLITASFAFTAIFITMWRKTKAKKIVAFTIRFCIKTGMNWLYSLLV